MYTHYADVDQPHIIAGESYERSLMWSPTQRTMHCVS